MMKKFFALTLALSMVFMLCACADSTKVKTVEKLISAIGEIGPDSETAIVAAEEAYHDLSDKEKAEVENYAVLLAAREAFNAAFTEKTQEQNNETAQEDPAAEEETTAPEETRKALVGEWEEIYCTLLYDKVSYDIYLADDGSCSGELDGYTWSFNEDKNSVDLYLDGSIAERAAIVDYDGITALVMNYPDTLSSVFVRKEERQRFMDQRFVTVKINMENVGDYVGDYVRAGELFDDGGNTAAEMGTFLFKSKAYEQGLVYVGCSSDFELELTFRSPFGEYTASLLDPFGCRQSADNETFFSFAKAEGTLYFVRAEDVAENYLTGDPPCRAVKLKDGTMIRSFLPSLWDQTDAEYDDWKY